MLILLFLSNTTLIIFILYLVPLQLKQQSISHSNISKVIIIQNCINIQKQRFEQKIMQNRYNNKKNNHFQQNFQQSSANLESLYRQSGQKYDNQQNDQGQAIQLLQIKSNGKVQLNNQALDIIASYNDRPVGFVALVGKYRTGKSFLLNKLLFLQKKKFKVQQYTNACTQGIWMWTNPFINQYLGNYLFFIDTEGLASLQKGQQNDVRIFTLATLISSYLVYNSTGCIDQRSISDLNAITKLSKNIMTEQNLSQQQNQRRLKDFMPNFCWVIRDFTLELKDQRGRNITPTQYLQNCLRDQTSYSRNQSQKIKKSLLNLFRDRDCVTLVRPARQENQLRSLDKLSDPYLRRQFIQGVNSLRQKIQRKAGCKMFQGKQLFGNDMACMIEAYAQTINEGKIPTIKSTWQQIVDNQGEIALQAGYNKYTQMFQQNFEDEEPRQQKQLNRILSRMKQQSLDEFKRNSTSDNDQHIKRLREWINKRQDHIRQANQSTLNSRNLQILKELSHPLMQKVQQNYYIGKKKQYEKDVQRVLQNYQNRAFGEKKKILLIDFITATNKIGQNLDRKPENYENNQYLVKQTQQMMKIKEQQNKSKSNQLNTAAKMAQQQEQKNRKRADMKKKKVQKAGCCGGKCQIM